MREGAGIHQEVTALIQMTGEVEGEACGLILDLFGTEMLMDRKENCSVAEQPE